MNMTAGEYPEGIDCVWLAADRKGHLGAFVTGGAGPIPKSVLSDSSAPIEDIEGVLCNMPQVSEVRLLVKMKRPDDFVEMAQRGFFVYDWRDVHRTMHESTQAYELIAMPTNPITRSFLPEPLKRVVANTTLPDLEFIEELVLDVTTKLECHNAG